MAGTTPRCIHTVFEQHARASPDRALLVDNDGFVTQRELLDAIDRRAWRLLEGCGATDCVVAVQLEPGIETAISYFACLTAGLRYLPLPLGPTRIVNRLLQCLRPRMLVTESKRAATSEADLDMLFVDSGEADQAESHTTHGAWPEPDPRRIAHVLPTSGTETGTPKAVLTDHVGSLLSHDWRSRLWPYDPARDVVACNIFGVWDMVPALCHGVPVVMIDDATMRDPFALAAAIIRFGITRLMLTPTLLDSYLVFDDAIDALRRLSRIVLCGEPVTSALMDRAWKALPDVRFGNLYSLSECHDVAGGELVAGEPMTCGRPAEFANVYITDTENRNRLAPTGVPGRVLIGGAALAAGYLDPTLSGERFFEASFSSRHPAARVYDSGDLGVLHEDGSLEILGRVDAARKVRGSWATPESIAAVFQEHPDVVRATVIGGTDRRGSAKLTAYIVPRKGGLPEFSMSLRHWIAERVASQSVPAEILIVDDLPLLPSGKVDTRRLRSIGRSASDSGAPSSGRGLESLVLATFRDVLDQPDLGPDESYEAVGGDSLSAVVLCGELQRKAHRRVSVSDLRLHPTAAALARELRYRARVGPRRNWRLPADLDVAIRNTRRSRRAAARVLVTGATGALGRAFVKHLLHETRIEIVALVRAADEGQARERLLAHLGADTDRARISPVRGDLALPRLGLERAVFRRLAAEIDAIVHLGADLDMFAEYEALAPVNVGGTREVLRLASEAGARVHHLSSNAVLPLGQDRCWDEDAYGFDFARALAPELARNDGYSRTKLAAEALVWQALERGLEVAVIRIPHLVGAGIGTRLSDTLRALLAIRALPEGEWRWQLAPVGAVCGHLSSMLESDEPPAPLVHLTAEPLHRLDVEDALERHGIGIRALSLPALVTALEDAGVAGEWARRTISGLNQLIREHGPHAAMSLADAELLSRHPQNVPPDVLIDSLISDADPGSP